MVTDDELARRRYSDLYGEYGLSDNDAAWRLFKSGWDAARQEAAVWTIPTILPTVYTGDD